MDWLIPRGRRRTWTSTWLRYGVLILCVLSLCSCVQALLKARWTLAVASREAESRTEAPEKAVRLMGSGCDSARWRVAWALKMLTVAVASGVGFLVLPAPANAAGEPSAVWTTRRRTAIRVFTVTGIFLLIGLAFLFGIGLAVYWMFSHMGP